MSEQKRLQILLQIICLLRNPGGYSVARLAGMYDVHSRTVYRYLEDLRECGFELEKSGDRYTIPHGGDYENLLPLLAPEEVSLLRDAVMALHPNHPRRVDLLKKLDILGDTGQLADLIVNRAVVKTTQKLLMAIREHRVVTLKNYRSSNSRTVRDRRVEPVGFSTNLKYLYAFDSGQEAVLQFKPERIGQVVVTDETFQPGSRHRIRKPDLFGMKGIPECSVTLKLTPRALNLLLEEFPESEEYVEKSRAGESDISMSSTRESGISLSGNGGQKNFSDAEMTDAEMTDESTAAEKGFFPDGLTTVKLDVSGFEGVGRFVLGLPGEAVPVGPTEFLDYLEERKGKRKSYR